MTRNRASAKAAGATFERQIADYLALTIDDRIDRRVKTGAKDRGDIGGVRMSPALGGHRVMIECKNEKPKDGSLSLGSWRAEVDVQKGNDDALIGLVCHKRHGVGWPGAQWVTMTVDDLVGLLTGSLGRDV